MFDSFATQKERLAGALRPLLGELRPELSAGAGEAEVSPAALLLVVAAEFLMSDEQGAGGAYALLDDIRVQVADGAIQPRSY